MSIITLTTDFGLKDYSVAAVKGNIYNKISDAKIVDITHLITPFNIIETAYILKNTYKNFPEKTIHIIGVNSEYNTHNKHLIFELNNQYFICADNGIISMIAEEIPPSKIIEIESKNTTTSFPTLNIFCEIASKIVKNKEIELLGKKINSYKKLTDIKAKTNSENSIIKGQVIYIDNYENIVTNIDKQLFENIAQNRNFTLTAGRYRFNKIHQQYNSIVDFSSDKTSYFEGKRLAIFNNANLIEIAVYKGNIETGGAASLLGINYRDNIIIEFEDHT